jgi:hypothetical protein
MSRLTSRCLRACILLLAFAILAPCALAAPFHGATYGYNLDIPETWMAIPQATVATFSRALSKPGAKTTVITDAAFQPSANKAPFTYPYVVVQVLPYSNVGVNRQIREDEFPGIVKAITGLDLKKTIDSQLSPKASSVLKSGGFGEPKLDAARHRFTAPLTMSVAGIGAVKGQVTGYFGHDALIQVAVYSLDQDPGAGELQQIADSFSFDSSTDFVPTPLNPLQRAFKESKPAELITLAIMIAVALGVYFYIRAKRKRQF